MREQIWGALVNVKFKGYCVGFLVDRFQKWERNINIFLAVASSGSIAAWVVWKEYPFLWGGIIAFSQVLTVVKPYLPYYKYVKELNFKVSQINTLSIDFEKLWYKLQYKKITDDESADIYFDLKKQDIEIFKFNDDSVFEVSKKIENKANKRMETYLGATYGIKIITN